MPGVVASAHLLVEAGSTVVAAVLVAEATRGCRRHVSRAPGVNRGFPHESDRSILQEILEFSLDTPPLGGGWLRHRSE
jgi:hypothetical protein